MSELEAPFEHQNSNFDQTLLLGSQVYLSIPFDNAVYVGIKETVVAFEEGDD